MGGGAGSPCFLRLARYPVMASLMLTSASARVLPCEMQPGSEGHSATNTPSSSASITTRYFMPQFEVVDLESQRLLHSLSAGSCVEGNRQILQWARGGLLRRQWRQAPDWQVWLAAMRTARVKARPAGGQTPD